MQRKDVQYIKIHKEKLIEKKKNFFIQTQRGREGNANLAK